MGNEVRLGAIVGTELTHLGHRRMWTTVSLNRGRVAEKTVKLRIGSESGKNPCRWLAPGFPN